MIVLDGSAAVDMARETSEGLALAQLLLDGEKVISHDLFSSEVCNAFWKYHHVSKLTRDEMSRNAKRVTATEKSVENEKYAFRCFLLRLGFIGSEYKAERKILLKNLTGSSAFKDGGVNHEVSE